MKKVIYFSLVVLFATSCARGYYAPHNVNQFGTQTQVVLEKGNFRIVRHIDVVVDINNTNLKRADVEKSAYAELLRRANLTGSQALINVVVEEVRRESSNIFRILFGIHTKVTQHVAARGTIIEFIDGPAADLNNSNPYQFNGTAPREVSKENSGLQDSNSELKYPVSETATTQIVKFKDSAFNKACLSKIDTNKDGQLTMDEVLVVEDLDVRSWGIKDMKGIELFKNLKNLYADKNQFTTIDLTENSELEYAVLKSSKLKSVYIKKNADVTVDVKNLVVRK